MHGVYVGPCPHETILYKLRQWAAVGFFRRHHDESLHAGYTCLEWTPWGQKPTASWFAPRGIHSFHPSVPPNRRSMHLVQSCGNRQEYAINFPPSKRVSASLGVKTSASFGAF
ncbi:hypothetical protein ABW21_db0203086 [Orbilia brochopaga]|nr:hypothetical protein ABW21_db0203086 [Drechslerella brochopaga]